MGRLSDGSYTVPRTEWRQAAEPSSGNSTNGQWWYKVSTYEIYYYQNNTWNIVGSEGGGGSAGDRGIFGGGYTGSASNVIDYITISTPGNATDFGDLTVAREGNDATSDGLQ